MRVTKEVSFTDVLFSRCKDDTERIEIIKNFYGVNNVEANIMLKKFEEASKNDRN